MIVTCSDSCSVVAIQEVNSCNKSLHSLLFWKGHSYGKPIFPQTMGAPPKFAPLLLGKQASMVTHVQTWQVAVFGDLLAWAEHVSWYRFFGCERAIGRMSLPKTKGWGSVGCKSGM